MVVKTDQQTKHTQKKTHKVAYNQKGINVNALFLPPPLMRSRPSNADRKRIPNIEQEHVDDLHVQHRRHILHVQRRSTACVAPNKFTHDRKTFNQLRTEHPLRMCRHADKMQVVRIPMQTSILNCFRELETINQILCWPHVKNYFMLMKNCPHEKLLFFFFQTYISMNVLRMIWLQFERWVI